MLRGLGVPADRMPVPVGEQLGLYRSLVHDRRILLVLDNGGSADHVLDDGEALALLTRMLGTARIAREPGEAADLARLCGRIPSALARQATR